MSMLSCPGCGESEELRGHSAGEQIEITCLTCGATFPREAPHCRACGRPDPAHGSQRMTRYARGLLVAVVGMRDVPLCRACDDTVVRAVEQRSELVPEGYISRFVFGEVRLAPAPAPAPPPKPVRSAGTTSHRTRAVSRPVRIVGRDARPSGEKSDEKTVRDPTVRQAMEAFLHQAVGQDSLCLVLLGTELGPSTRLTQLDDLPREALPAWIRNKFAGTSTERYASAVSTISELVDYWRDQGWISNDIASALR